MIQRLIEGITAKDAPVVVGLDPNISFIPGFILKKAESAAEGDIPDYCEKENVIAAEAVWQFNKAITDAVYDIVMLCHYCCTSFERVALSWIREIATTIMQKMTALA